jgi:hypothetical protein
MYINRFLQQHVHDYKRDVFNLIMHIYTNKRIVTRYNSADSVPPSIDGAQRIHPMFADTEILEFSILTFFRLKHDLVIGTDCIDSC